MTMPPEPVPPRPKKKRKKPPKKKSGKTSKSSKSSKSGKSGKPSKASKARDSEEEEEPPTRKSSRSSSREDDEDSADDEPAPKADADEADSSETRRPRARVAHAPRERHVDRRRLRAAHGSGARRDGRRTRAQRLRGEAMHRLPQALGRDDLGVAAASRDRTQHARLAPHLDVEPHPLAVDRDRLGRRVVGHHRVPGGEGVERRRVRQLERQRELRTLVEGRARSCHPQSPESGAPSA